MSSCKNAQSGSASNPPDTFSHSTSRVPLNRAGSAGKAQFRAMDLFETDLAPATVVAFYLLPEFNAKLQSRLSSECPLVPGVYEDGDLPPYFRPAEDSIEYQYMMERRKALGGSPATDLIIRSKWSL